MIAGVHAIGSPGAVAYLADSDHVGELHNTIGTRRFSMVIGSSITRAPLKILTAETLTQPRPHEQ